MAPSFVRRYGQRVFFVTTWHLVTVAVTLGAVVSARNDNVTDSGMLYDDHLKWNDYRYLEGLPLDQLLLLQRKVGELGSGFFSNATTSEPLAEAREMPEGDLTDKNERRHMYASPLKMQNPVDRRSSAEPWNTKPSKVQKIFQISITGLAFLAFAGYLLCMIVQAIKSKGTTYYHPTITGTATLTSAIKKRKPFMRRKRDLTYITPLDGYDAVQLHQMLVTFAERYANAPGS
ncbi:uncharacterized protein LOC128711639 [Anopheles marshallii]|uniref:uncharacterized protein LOC128711639 n=1 Tax=Anopheles marshallii TaxID=1521116 RepID=UPI00237C4A42|nr:uncharacterized protein LOC128711639 [Anopheles marshallii]